MPVHDWTRVDAALFHAFHQRWINEISDTLNRGGLPADYYALPEQPIRGPVPDVLTLQVSTEPEESDGRGPAVAVAEAPPRAQVIRKFEPELLARRADRVAVRHRHGEVVAVIEVVSPGNKSSVRDFRDFIEKVSDLIRQGIHVLMIDVFPPTRRDPDGLHKALWDEFIDEEFTAPAGKSLTLASYAAGTIKTAYVEPFGVGDELSEMPLFLTPEVYVPVKLETTYETCWGVFPRQIKRLLGTL